MLPHLSSSPVYSDTSSQETQGFREGYLPLPLWHLSALVNLALSAPLPPFPAKEKRLERSFLFTSHTFSNENMITFGLV